MTTQHYIFLENVRFYSYHGVAPPGDRHRQ